MAASGGTKAVAPESLVRQSFVDPDKFYKVTLQFGGKQSWKPYPNGGLMSGQKRIPKPSLSDPGKFEYHHNPKIYEDCGPYKGDVVNGLIQSHNDWVRAFSIKKENDSTGHLDNQLMVLAFFETTDVPAASGIGQDMLSIIDAVVKRALSDASNDKRTAAK